jgi:membrane associated rhomboid family serine protease
MIPISDAPGARHRFPIVNVVLILANIVVFVLFELGAPSEAALNRLIQAAGVIPSEIIGGVDRQPLSPLGGVYGTLVTAMFLHGGLMHLGGNMLYLWVFGDNVEDNMGHVPYALFYLLCGMLAGVAHIVMNLSSNVPSIGASGAIAGVLAAYLVLFPRSSVRTLLFIGPFITMPRISAFFLIGFWFVLQLLSGWASLDVRAEQTSGVAVWAHVGGFVAGFFLVYLFRSRKPAYAALAG